MPPREATNPFPDQFLTLDYESQGPIALPHDTPPPLNGNNNSEDEQSFGEQTQPPVEEQASDENPTLDDPLSNEGLDGGMEHMTYHPGQGGTLSPSSMSSTVQHNPSASSSSRNLDPLSIDPTQSAPTFWSDTPFGMDVAVQTPASSAAVAVTPASPSHASPRRRTTSVDSLGSTQPPTQSSPVLLSTPSMDHHRRHVSMAMQHARNYVRQVSSTSISSSHAARHLGSILDADPSAESDAEEDLPELDSTLDSNSDQEEFSTPETDDGSTDGSNALPYASSPPDNHRTLRSNPAFDLSSDSNPRRRNRSIVSPSPSSRPYHPSPPSPVALSFGPSTTVADLKYFAERGCIVGLLAALRTPRLKTLGARMLADYAKMPTRRVAVASNRRILQFVQSTMLQSEPCPGEDDSTKDEYADPLWLGREYAVETVRSLTATEESDRYLMNAPGLLQSLAHVARGEPFSYTSSSLGRKMVSLASGKARLHACIAVMNLSCSKSNKIEIANIPDVLEAMRDVMLGTHFTSGQVAQEARLKATTCIKNLSNADANDAALLGTPGLVEAVGHVARETCGGEGATTCTTNACLALMNLSISKGNKHRVFRTPGIMDALIAVITRTSPLQHSNSPNAEARVKACSALSNLAIGYDNKIPMFSYPGFVESILHVIDTDGGEARTKACSILWSFAAEMKNQVPVVQRGDILPTLVRVAEEDATTEARFKCVAALTLLAESLENAIPLLESGALAPLMVILHDAGPDPTQWKGQTASWCVGFLMNMAQSDEAVPALRESGVVELLAPLLTLDHYQSLKAAMAVTFVCRYDEGDETYDLLRKTENVIPKIISLLHNTLSGRGGNGYKYGVFTLRSSVGCIASLASGPDFMKERIATSPVFESLLRVVADFCVDGGTPGAIVGGGRDDGHSATLAVRALQSLTQHLIPIPGCSALPFDRIMEERLIIALQSFEVCTHEEVTDITRKLASDAKLRIQGGANISRELSSRGDGSVGNDTNDMNKSDDMMDDAVGSIAASFANNCCGLSIASDGESLFPSLPSHLQQHPPVSTPAAVAPSPTPNAVELSYFGDEIVEVDDSSASSHSTSSQSDSTIVRTFLLADQRTGRKFAVPSDPTGGRAFNDNRVWCYRRGRFCRGGESPDPNFRWSVELQAAYMAALEGQRRSLGSPSTTAPTTSGNGSVVGKQ